MKKSMIALAALLLMFTYGCGSDEEAETTADETVIESQERAAEMRSEDTIAPDETAVETEEETEPTDDTVKEPRKRPVIEGC